MSQRMVRLLPCTCSPGTQRVQPCSSPSPTGWPSWTGSVRVWLSLHWERPWGGVRGDRWLGPTAWLRPAVQLSGTLPQEPYLQSHCGCCSYSLDPESPVRILNLRCPGGRTEPVVLPAIRSCQCSACLGGSGGALVGEFQGGVGTGAGLPKGTHFPTHRPPWDSSFLTPSDLLLLLLGSVVEFSSNRHKLGGLKSIRAVDPSNQPIFPSLLSTRDLSLTTRPTMPTGSLGGLRESTGVKRLPGSCLSLGPRGHTVAGERNRCRGADT